MIDFADAARLVRESLAAEYGCSVDDLLRPGMTLTSRPALAALSEIARRYPPNDPPLQIVSLGRGAVVAARPDLHPAIAPLLTDRRDDLFSVGMLTPLIEVIRRQGYRLVGPYLRLLCGSDTLRRRGAPTGYTVQVHAAPDLAELRTFDTGDWPYATGARMFDGRSPTAALAVARCGAILVGVASLSAEATHLRQIGIDVAEGHQRRGIGAALVAMLTAHALDSGTAPWYGVAPANLASIHTALAAGFRHTWVEIYAVPA